MIFFDMILYYIMLYYIINMNIYIYIDIILLYDIYLYIIHYIYRLSACITLVVTVKSTCFCFSPKWSWFYTIAIHLYIIHTR